MDKTDEIAVQFADDCESVTVRIGGNSRLFYKPEFLAFSDFRQYAISTLLEVLAERGVETVTLNYKPAKA